MAAGGSDCSIAAMVDFVAAYMCSLGGGTNAEPKELNPWVLDPIAPIVEVGDDIWISRQASFIKVSKLDYGCAVAVAVAGDA